MSTPWDQFIDAMERRRKQLDELLESYKVFRGKLDSLPPELAAEAQKILAESSAATEHVEQDLVGKTALQCAGAILRERNNTPMHFAEIAQEAMRRGYKGRTEGSQSEVAQRIVQSFWAALHRSEYFEATGKGCYREKGQPVTVWAGFGMLRNKAQVSV